MAKCSSCGSPACACGPIHYSDSPAKQVANVDPMTGLPVNQTTNIPPQQSNALGASTPVFNPQAQQVAQGIYGDVGQRQNAVGASSSLFQLKKPGKSLEGIEEVDQTRADNLKQRIELHKSQANKPVKPRDIKTHKTKLHEKY